MKTVYLILLLCISLLPATAQRQSAKETKAIQAEENFRKTLALAESNHFKIDINRVYPQGGRDVSRFNPSGTITINDSTAQGRLPFFGRAYSLPYGEGGGIEFDAVMKNRVLKIEEKRKKKIIYYRFSIPAKGDNYQVNIEIFPGGNCTVHLTSNNRASISYSGLMSPDEKEMYPQK